MKSIVKPYAVICLGYNELLLDRAEDWERTEIAPNFEDFRRIRKLVRRYDRFSHVFKFDNNLEFEKWYDKRRKRLEDKRLHIIGAFGEACVTRAIAYAISNNSFVTTNLKYVAFARKGNKRDVLASAISKEIEELKSSKVKSIFVDVY